MKRPARPSLEARFVAAVKRERARLGWTQERTANEVGLNLRHYQKLEQGVVTPTLRTLERLANAFGVEPTRLLE